MTRPAADRPPTWGPPAGLVAAPRPAWSRSGTGRAGDHRWSAAVAATAVALTTAALLTAWVATWFRWPTRVAFVLVGAGYETNLAVPPNVTGWNTVTRLATVADPAFSARPPVRWRAGEKWDRDLDDANAPVVVAYLALHGGADDAGAYLLPEDADGRDVPDQRLRVAAVIDRLARLPASTAKVLILDAVQFESWWPFGWLRNEFANTLLTLNDRVAAVPNLLVVCGSGPRQRSWASPDYRETFFGRAVRDALAGRVADPSRDGWIQLDEWFDDVARRVETQVRANRGVVQAPILLPTGAEGRRRAGRVTLVRARPIDDELPAPPPGDVPPELAAAWQNFQQLRAWQPAAPTFAPHLFTEYLNALLRYEVLILTGDAASADRARDKLRDLADALDRARRLSLDSVQNTLTMPAIAGLPVRRADADAAADELWALSPSDAAARWPKLLAPHAADPTFRPAVMRRLFDLALGAPTFLPDRLAALVRLTEDAARPRPAEAQTVIIQHRDFPSPPPPDRLVQKAVEVRLLAERAMAGVGDDPNCYPFAERAIRFTRGLIERADARRLTAQDRLMLGDAKLWPEVAADLDTASADYRTALDLAVQIRDGLADWQRVASHLPSYTRWLATRPRPASESEWAKLDAGVERVVALWTEWHAIAREFQAAGPDHFRVVTPLSRRTTVLAGQLDELEREFTAYAANLAGVNLPSIWHDTEAAMAVPFLDPQIRRRMIENLRRTSWTFLTQARSDTGRPADATADADPSDEMARRQGRLALATIGPKWFDDPAEGRPVAGWETFDVTARRLATFAAEPDGWLSQRRAGVEIGRRFQRLPDEINARVGRRDRADLQWADALCRITPAGPALRIAVNPAPLLRQNFLTEFLTVQARRTWAEHWGARDPSVEPYYRRAARLFLADAAGDTADRAELKARVDGPGGIQWTTPPDPLDPGGVIALTSELAAPVNQRLGPATGAVVPPGLAAWSIEAGPGLSAPGALRRPAAIADQPTPVVAPVANAAEAESEAAPPDRPETVASRVTLRAWYRGHRVEQVRPVVTHPRPAVIVNQFAEPHLASLTVRAGESVVRRFGRGVGAVAIVLDCSGSMGPPAGVAFDERTKFAQAITALEEVLPALPDGSSLSVWVFGQAEGAEKTVAEPETTIRAIRPHSPWRHDQLGDLVRELRYPALTPWNESPILRAMAAARADLVAQPGPRTLLVLTDGRDNRFEHDKTLNPKGLPFAAVLTDIFHGTGIDVRVVGFRVEAKEAKAAAEQFAALARLEPPGSFTTADHAAALAAAFRRVLRPQLRVQVETAERLPVAGVGDAGLPVGSGPGGDRWVTSGLAPGGFRVRLVDGDAVESDIVLSPADRLILALDQVGGRLRFGRAPLTADFPGRPTRERHGWQLALVQNQRVGTGAQWLATLTRSFDSAERQLQMPRPRMAWFEVEGDGRPAVEWHAVEGYPAAAWSLSSPAFPVPPARPVVRAWWSPDRDAPPAARIERGADFRELADVRNVAVTIDGGPAVVRELAIETHSVDVSPGRREPRSCLVVRVAHGPGNAVRVRTAGLPFTGSAHWFYPDAGGVTALFWPVTPEQAQALTAVELVSLRAFRREAEGRGFTAAFEDLPPPDPADERPRPPLPLP